jgi:type IV secretion system protein VirB4
MMNLAEYRRHSQNLADFLPWAALVGKGCQSALNSFQGTASKTFHFVRLVSAVFCAA